jgi:hypothetical protein
MAGEGAGAGFLELKEADPLHQLRPIVLHIADLIREPPHA